jgi:anti-sigma factor RsiW
MNCQELVETITMYLEGALPEIEKRRFEAHLSQCRGCTHYVEQMRITLRLVGMLSEQALPPGSKARLLQLFRDLQP